MSIKKTEINGRIFIKQTTYYIYDSKKDLMSDIPILTTSNKSVFEKHKQIYLNSLK